MVRVITIRVYKVKMWLNETYNKVRVGKYLSHVFQF
jgi:hypothetical protein